MKEISQFYYYYKSDVSVFVRDSSRFKGTTKLRILFTWSMQVTSQSR